MAGQGSKIKEQPELEDFVKRMPGETECRGIAEALLRARTEADTEAIIRLANTLYGGVKWRHFGDRPNNIGTIRLGSDPALGVVERVINGMDSLLDLGKAQHPQECPGSPNEAAHAWYGVPFGGIAEMGEGERRLVGEKLKVWLDESGDDRRPTVVWEDHGLGQSAVDFPKTFVSLNESNKVAQSWNMGTYGQGGAVTLGFSKATIILSRRHSDFLDGRPDTVGWTIVKEFDPDPNKLILPTWMYLVGVDDQVPELPHTCFPELPHGSRVTAIAYDLQGWTGPYTTGLWQFLHAAIFDPVLPFLVTGKRKKEERYGTRIVTGNVARLNRPERARGDLEIAHRNSTRLELGADNGAVSFNYWVVRRPTGSESRSEPAAAYVKPDSAVSMTLFGQRQDTESRTWIRTTALLPFLYKNVIVQIDANRLTARAKRELFASTRERATKSGLRDRIYEALGDVLRDDEELKRLNHEERERLLAQSTATSSAKVRKRLAKFVKTRLRDIARPGKGGVDSGTGGTRKQKPGVVSPPRDTDDSALPVVPTHLKIARKLMQLNQGGKCWTWAEVDAKNGYLPENDDCLSVEIGPPADGHQPRLTMRSQLLGGKSRWTFEADADTPLGEYVLIATLITASGVLSDQARIVVRTAPPAQPDRTGTEPETGPDVRWVTKGEWEDHGMDAHSVGYVTEDQEETVIFVNRDYHLLEKSLNRRNLTEEQVTTRADRYQFPVACALWLQEDASKKADPVPSEDYRRAELERLAEAVLLAADPDVDIALGDSEV